MNVRLFAAAALVVSEAGSAIAGSPLQPIGTWTTESEPTCVIQRDFGSARKPVRFELRAIPTLDEIYLSITDYGRADSDEFVPATVSFNPTQPPIHDTMEIYQIKGSKQRFGWLSFGRDRLQAAVSTSHIDLNAEGFMKFSFVIPDLSKGLAALDECEASELDHWGMSREEQKEIASWPRIVGPASKYVSSEDYPPEAIVAMSTGVNSARVAVDEAGVPSDCLLLETSHNDALDQKLCTVLLRFRFRPATDPSGHPLRSFKALRFDWRIPPL
jgi:hypothetical protein